MKKFIHVTSPKFAILAGEKQELVNDGMYGKALAEYLQSKLKERRYNVPFFCCEDWGWWVEIKDTPFTFGVCIYSGLEESEPLDLFCTDGAAQEKVWSWSKFRFIDTRPWAEKLHGDLVAIFSSDPDVSVVGTSLDSPFSDAKDA